MSYDSEHRNPNFDADGNMVDAQGAVLVPSHIFETYLPGVRRPGRPQQFQGERKPCQILSERWSRSSC